MAAYRNRSRAIAERLILLRKYIHENSTSTHAVKATDMLDFLAEQGYKIEIKTLYSDLAMLETCFEDVKLDYDGRQRGYILNNPPFESYDLRLIVNSIQAAQFITQEEANRLTNKMIGLADKYTRTLLDRRTFVVNRTRTMNNKLIEDLDAIYTAIAQDRKISYRYLQNTADGDKAPDYVAIDGSKIITASPVGVVWTGAWYMIIVARKVSDKIQQYVLRLDQMEQIKTLEEPREGVSAAHDAYKVFQRAFDEKEDDEWRTKLRVSNDFISNVAEKFGQEATIAPLNGKYSIVTLNTYPTPELYMWAAAFTPRIEIIDPPDAEDELRGYFADLANGEEAIPPFP